MGLCLFFFFFTYWFVTAGFQRRLKTGREMWFKLHFDETNSYKYNKITFVVPWERSGCNRSGWGWPHTNHTNVNRAITHQEGTMTCSSQQVWNIRIWAPTKVLVHFQLTRLPPFCAFTLSALSPQLPSISPGVEGVCCIKTRNLENQSLTSKTQINWADQSKIRGDLMLRSQRTRVFDGMYLRGEVR